MLMNCMKLQSRFISIIFPLITGILIAGCQTDSANLAPDINGKMLSVEKKKDAGIEDAKLNVPLLLKPEWVKSFEQTYFAAGSKIVEDYHFSENKREGITVEYLPGNYSAFDTSSTKPRTDENAFTSVLQKLFNNRYSNIRKLDVGDKMGMRGFSATIDGSCVFATMSKQIKVPSGDMGYANSDTIIYYFVCDNRIDLSPDQLLKMIDKMPPTGKAEVYRLYQKTNSTGSTQDNTVTTDNNVKVITGKKKPMEFHASWEGSEGQVSGNVDFLARSAEGKIPLKLSFMSKGKEVTCLGYVMENLSNRKVGFWNVACDNDNSAKGNYQSNQDSSVVTGLGEDQFGNKITYTITGLNG